MTATPTVTTAIVELPAPASPIHLAASTDDSRPILTAVQAREVDGVPCYVATDSYVLAIVPMEGDELPSLEVDAKIPADMIGEAVKASKKGSASVAIDGSRVDAKLAPYGKRASTVHGRQVDGQFPDCVRLMPDYNGDSVRIGVDVDRLLQVAKAIRDTAKGASSGNVVELEVPTNPLRPIIVRQKGTDRRGLVMPVNLDRR